MSYTDRRTYGTARRHIAASLTGGGGRRIIHVKTKRNGSNLIGTLGSLFELLDRVEDWGLNPRSLLNSTPNSLNNTLRGRSNPSPFGFATDPSSFDNNSYTWLRSFQLSLPQLIADSCLKLRSHRACRRVQSN